MRKIASWKSMPTRQLLGFLTSISGKLPIWADFDGEIEAVEEINSSGYTVQIRCRGERPMVVKEARGLLVGNKRDDSTIYTGYGVVRATSKAKLTWKGVTYPIDTIEVRDGTVVIVAGETDWATTSIAIILVVIAGIFIGVFPYLPY